MTPADRELLHLSVIRYLATRGLRFGTPVRMLMMVLRSEAFPAITAEEVLQELEYLGDATNALGKSLVISVTKLNPAESRWNLTAAGREFAQLRGIDQP
ncbi:MAG: hypothetical protein U1G08_02420 [Verrucomicrobiota bacterium]